MSDERTHTHFQRFLRKLSTLAGLQVNLKRVIMKNEEARNGKKIKFLRYRTINSGKLKLCPIVYDSSLTRGEK